MSTGADFVFFEIVNSGLLKVSEDETAEMVALSMVATAD